MSEVILTITRVDDQVVAFLNGRIVYEGNWNGDEPVVNDVTNLTLLLQSGDNNLLLVGVNTGGKCHFAGQLDVYGTIDEFNFEKSSTSDGIVWNRYYTFARQ